MSTGFYPDLPGVRLALDVDGTQILGRNDSLGGTWTDYTASLSTLVALDQPEIGIAASGQYIVYSLMFPDLIDLAGIYINAREGRGGSTGDTQRAYSVSSDTTNGLDGIWTDYVNFSSRSYVSSSHETDIPYYRTNIFDVPGLSNVKGLRIRTVDTITVESISLLYMCTVPVRFHVKV